MSQGNPPQGAPARTLVSLLLAEPAVDSGGRLNPWFGQVLQRLLTAIGPVGGSDGSGSSDSVYDQLSNITNNQSVSLGSQGIDGASQARLIALEQAVAPLLPRMPPRAPPPPLIPFPGGGANLANEGVGLDVYDATTSSTVQAYLRTIIGQGGITVSYSADGHSLIISGNAANTLGDGQGNSLGDGRGNSLGAGA